MNGQVLPFLKWAGGKRWLAQKDTGIFDAARYKRHVEPFAGSAAIFFASAPKKAVLNDLNEDLICTYQALKNDWRSVYIELKKHNKLHSSDYYYAMRLTQPRSITKRASRFIYLNRTCFNGLYRVNLSGKFNVPIGSKSSVLLDTDDFEKVSNLLRNTKLTCLDFESVIDGCGKEDLIFCDPPYTVKHNYNGFIKYNERLFSWSDQERLKVSLMRAKDRGASVIVSNADHESIRELYSDATSIDVITRQSVMAADSRKRKETSELLITL